MATEHVILGTQIRNLKTKPVVLKFSSRTGHVQLLRALSTELHIKPDRSAAQMQENLTKEFNARPRDRAISTSTVRIASVGSLWSCCAMFGMKPARKGRGEPFGSCLRARKVSFGRSPIGILSSRIARGFIPRLVSNDPAQLKKGTGMTPLVGELKTPGAWLRRTRAAAGYDNRTALARHIVVPRSSAKVPI
jgi:hypothetical protein